MAVYYNEFDPQAADWLENLMWDGLIPEGYVDRRSIVDVRSEDLRGFTSCHFFAGIGGWPLALRLAGWPDDLPVWTGSPPCQPFSAAGKQRGKADPRHLAPTWARLVKESQPPILFGEQVDKAIGKHWLDDLSDELEAAGYAVGSAVLAAGSVGAPHQRSRLFFGAYRLADTDCFRADWQSISRVNAAAHRAKAFYWPELDQSGTPGGTGGDVLRGVANDDSERSIGRGKSEVRAGEAEQRAASIGSHEVGAAAGLCPPDELAHGAGQRCEGVRLFDLSGCTHHEAAGYSEALRMAHQHRVGLQGERADGNPERQQRPNLPADRLRHRTGAEGLSGTHYRAWGGADWLLGVDGNFRPVRPGTQPLAHGLSGIVGPGSAQLKKLASRNRNARLKGYGNAIVPGLAAEFIIAFTGAIDDSDL